MTEFDQLYRQAFAGLGRSLGPDDQTPEGELAAAEARLGVSAPAALRTYYQVAGRADDFNRRHERLLRPADWFIESGRLVFMEENQVVVLYGTPPASAGADPPAYLAANADPIRWEEVNAHVSTFLLVLLHWQATFGGALPHVGTADVAPEARERLDAGWAPVGEVNGMRAYHRPGSAVCCLEWGHSWRAFAGAVESDGLVGVADELHVRWDD